MDTAKKTKIYHLVVLDKSGSMNSIRKEAIDGCNETLGSIRATHLKYQDTQEHFVSLATFCGCGVEMIYDALPIDQAKDLTQCDYTPCCMTPLFDAIGISVNALRKKTADNEGSGVLVTIITDGHENASKEWNSKTVCKLIDECKEEGWMFSFLGAGSQFVEVATEISITNTMVWENTSVGTQKMFMKENEARTRFCTTFDKLMHMRCHDIDGIEKKEILKNLSMNYYEDDI